ncbi:MAG: SAM-dependent methyltransferase [Pseudomonadota bacterium]|nr:SAM-dependent methyltransferase [Pseudomonadota bacterium]
MPQPAPTSPEAFESKYRAAADPWNFRTSSYERDRYRQLLACLGRPRYLHALEPGCSIGELTAQLAERCDQVTATDVSTTALERARRRCAAFPHVSLLRADLGSELPAGGFDLIMLCEIGYYFDRAALAGIAERLEQALLPGGELVVSHWLGHSADHVLHADEVHQVITSTLTLRQRESGRYPGFRLDTWMKE